jgi:rhodanese-related sulfurtransferase
MIQTISVAELKELRANTIEHLLIDVREQDEYDAGHIDGSILIPMGELRAKIDDVAKQKDQLVVLHCAAGRRSALSAEELQDMGYTNVKSLEGGFQAWY